MTNHLICLDVTRDGSLLVTMENVNRHAQLPKIKLTLWDLKNRRALDQQSLNFFLVDGKSLSWLPA